MIAEHWYAALLLTFIAGYLIGDVARRAIEAEKRRRDRRTKRSVERAWRESYRSTRTPW